ncbi:peptidoglycan-binding protein [Sorangium sp. So ce341]|uniref:peptidoglycan-binding protein n=1 Tax=Sorangium sp. So ce341 TaxID=3133302 RepID=UPI003F60AC3B
MSGKGTGDEGTDAAHARPVGNGSYVVGPGDGMSSIADRTGFFWETLWNLEENAALKAARDNPEILMPGDRVTIPERRIKEVPCETARRHRFRRRGVPVRVIFTVEDDGGRRFAGAKYLLKVGEAEYRGETGADGSIEQWVTPAARTGTLTVWPDREPFTEALEWRIGIGELDPIDSIAGVQARLSNLAYDCGAERGALGPKTRRALRLFQHNQGIEVTGAIDEATVARLRDVYGA